MAVTMTIKGLQEAQQANQRRLAELKPTGALGRAIQYATATLQRHAIGVTHVDTGSLRASHRMRLEAGGLRGVIYIDPSAVNPRSGQKTSVYGPHEHARGGSHAFYARTVSEAGPQVEKQAGNLVRVALVK
jgi:hypothetical protein